MNREQLAREARRYIEQHLLAADPTDPSHLDALKPTSADYQELFGDLAPELEDSYSGLWSTGLPQVSPRRTQVRLALGTAAEIAEGAQDGFPGGFVKIAPTLPPDSVWVAFECIEPGKSAGMAFNGLVWRTDGRWAWFPKVWRMLRA